MGITMAWDPVDHDDAAVLWLWRAHNRVNARLKGDSTEDPIQPKVQFPPSNLCSTCWIDDRFQDNQVLRFLRSFYGSTLENRSELSQKHLEPSSGMMRTISGRLERGFDIE